MTQVDATRLPPTPTVQRVHYPLPLDKDFQAHAKMVKEKWALHFPLVAYRQLLNFPTGFVGNDDHPQPNTGGTIVDPLYGESVPAVNVDGAWAQPHSPLDAPGMDAARADRFGEIIRVHARIQTNVREYVLKYWGIEQEFDIIVTFCVPELDDRRIFVRPGDEVAWHNQTYKVHQALEQGWWFNTEAYMYVVASCNKKHEGA